MSDGHRTGHQPVEPGQRLAGIPARRAARRRARLRPSLDVGPPAGDLRRPGPADLRGLHRAGRRRGHDVADPRWACSSAPTRSATRAWRSRRSPPSTTSAAAAPSWASAGPGSRGSTGRSASTSGRGSASAWTGWPRPSRRCARCSTARRSRARPAGATRSTACGSTRRPLQARLPIMIGGAGERKTLRIVAEHADIWNAFGTPEVLAHKDAVLRAHCADVGRDPAAIERTVGCKITIRSTEAEAERVRRAMLAHNRTPLAARRGRRDLLDRHARADRRDDGRLPADRLPHVHRRARAPRTTTRRWRRSCAW